MSTWSLKAAGIKEEGKHIASAVATDHQLPRQVHIQAEDAHAQGGHGFCQQRMLLEMLLCILHQEQKKLLECVL